MEAYRVIRWRSRGVSSDLGDVGLLQDDSIAAVKAKVADALRVHHTHVHVWAALECDVTDDDFARQATARLLARDVTRHPQEYSWDDVRKRVNSVFPDAPEKAFPRETPSFAAVLRYVRGLDVTHTARVLGHDWWSHNQVETIKSCDPFADVSLDPDFVGNFATMQLRTDSKYASGLLQQLYVCTLHVCTLGDVLAACPDPGSETWFLGFARVYFPYARDSLARTVPYRESDACVAETVATVANRNWVHAEWAMARMHVRVESHQAASYASAHADVFDAFKLSRRVRMAKYATPEEYYRIASDALNDVDGIKALSEVGTRGKNQCIVWKVELCKNGTCFVKLDADMQLDVTFSFRRTPLGGAIDIVDRAIGHINDTIIRHIRATSNAVISDIDGTAIWDPPKEGSRTRVMGMCVSTTFFDADARAPDAAEFVSGLRGLDPLLMVIDGAPSSQTNVAVQYVRVARFEPMDAVRYYAMRNAHFPRKALASALARTFHLNAAGLRDVMASLETSDTRAVVTARVTCNPSVNVTVRVRGATHLHEVRRVVDAVKHACVRGVTLTLPRVTPDAIVSDSRGQNQAIDDDIVDFLDEFQDGAETAYDDVGDEDEHIVPSQRDDTLDALKLKDPDLFDFPVPSGYRSYASQCGKVDRRQPIVLTEEEKSRQDATNPDGLGVPILYGSDATMHYYACPDVFCPKSKTAMTYEQLESGRKCPNPSETPVTFESRYWMGRERKRHVGFITGSNHPDGLCMPCCFKLPLKNFGTCYDTGKHKRNITYIKEFKYILEAGRVSLLPNAMHRFFNPNRGLCGSRPDDAGNVTDHTDCTVRLGLPDRSFGEIMADVLSADVSSVVSRIDADTFVRIEGGAVARHYLALAREGEGSTDADGDRRELRDGLLREARRLFSEDVVADASGNIPPGAGKRLSHAFLQDAIARTFDVDIVVFDLNASKDGLVTVHVHPTRVGSDRYVGLFHWSAPVEKYELVVRARHESGRPLRLDRVLHGVDDVDRLVTRYDAPTRALKRIDEATRRLGWEIDRLVLDAATAFARGVFLKKESEETLLFLPLPDPLPCPLDDQWEWMFLDDALDVSQKHRRSTVTQVLSTVCRATGDPRWTAPETLLDARDKTVGLRTAFRGVVPLDSEGLSRTKHAEWFTHGVHVMLRRNADDPRLLEASERIADDTRIADMVPGVLGVLSMDQPAWQELRFLVSDVNPFDARFRDERVRHIVAHSLRGMSKRDLPPKLAERVVEDTARALTRGVDSIVRSRLRERPRERLLDAFQVRMLVSARD